MSWVCLAIPGAAQGRQHVGVEVCAGRQRAQTQRAALLHSRGCAAGKKKRTPGHLFGPRAMWYMGDHVILYVLEQQRLRKLDVYAMCPSFSCMRLIP